MMIEKFKNKKIGVLCGGFSSEREISLKSGAAVFQALRSLKLKACLIDVGRDLAKRIKQEKIDAAFICLHGNMGEDGTVQGMLEIMGVAYTGCAVLASAISMDKAVSKTLFRCAGLSTPDWFTLKKFSPLPSRIKYPVVVKPSGQGSAIGVSIVKSEKDFAKAVKKAFRYDCKIIVEQFIKGAEITVGVLDGKPLPVVEIVPKSEFYDFKSKYSKGGSKHIIPARISPKASKAAQSAAQTVYEIFNCRALCRADMIVDKNDKVWVLENNTLPGMTQTSLLPDEAKAAGLDFNALVLKILESAFE
ncbi:MAG: D-alanine--D-alanine ligase [Endomicrobium sp.]|jgi:D-alanine-D-alanine ligase|nr:D-alanine--D-alanine ligase [Endomicrobium sp.]